MTKIFSCWAIQYLNYGPNSILFKIDYQNMKKNISNLNKIYKLMSFELKYGKDFGGGTFYVDLFGKNTL